MNDDGCETKSWIENQLKEFRKSDKGKKLISRWNKYQNHRYHKKCNGTLKSFVENVDCSLWLGIHIAEKILPEIYENVMMMPFNNKGFDAICSKNYKIDVKSSCVHINNGYGYLSFDIDYNEIADYFIMFAFDNRTDLNLLYVWVIRGDEIVRGRRLNEFQRFTITNNDRKRKEFEKYQLSEYLFNKAKESCEKLKSDLKMKLRTRYE